MATQRVLGAQVYDLLTFRCCEQKTRHLKIQRLSLVPRQYNRKPIQAVRYSLWIYSVGRAYRRTSHRPLHHIPTHHHPVGRQFRAYAALDWFLDWFPQGRIGWMFGHRAMPV